MKMNWKINVKDLKITKKQMTLWMSSVLLSAAALVVLARKKKSSAK